MVVVGGVVTATGVTAAGAGSYVATGVEVVAGVVATGAVSGVVAATVGTGAAAGAAAVRETGCPVAESMGPVPPMGI